MCQDNKDLHPSTSDEYRAMKVMFLNKENYGKKYGGHLVNRESSSP